MLTMVATQVTIIIARFKVITCRPFSEFRFLPIDFREIAALLMSAKITIHFYPNKINLKI